MEEWEVTTMVLEMTSMEVDSAEEWVWVAPWACVEVLWA